MRVYQFHMCYLEIHFSNMWTLNSVLTGKFRHMILLFVIFLKVMHFKLKRTEKNSDKLTKCDGPTDTTGLRTNLQAGLWGSWSFWMAFFRCYLVIASIWNRKKEQLENISLFIEKAGTWNWGYGHYAKNTKINGQSFLHFQLCFQ